VSLLECGLRLSPTLNIAEEEESMLNNMSGDRKLWVVGLSKENKEEAKKKEKVEEAQKDDTLQPITKVNTKLDKELQQWEVESTKGGGNDGGG
jgi:hypothetical protein